MADYRLHEKNVINYSSLQLPQVCFYVPLNSAVENIVNPV
jgi:hypothetical protein